MKQLLLILAVLSLAACKDPDQMDRPVQRQYKPLLMDRAQLENSIKFSPARPLKNPGKIYHYNSLLFVSETFKGMHIIDNSDPMHPVNKGFITIPGCNDVSIKDNILYSDNATDMVAINISDYANPVVTERLRNTFPETGSPDGTGIPYEFHPGNRPANTIIVEWVKAY